VDIFVWEFSGVALFFAMVAVWAFVFGIRAIRDKEPWWKVLGWFLVVLCFLVLSFAMLLIISVFTHPFVWDCSFWTVATSVYLA
jgi:multisubunit Na+/H+ antiporter MnhB subunit